MSYPGLNTYMINSHGDFCSPGETVELPENVFVIMNCAPQLTYTNHLIDAFLWKFACKYQLENKSFSKAREEVYKKYIGSLLAGLKSALHNPHALTEFCLFSGKCPNISLNFNEQKFRTGVFKLPVTITDTRTNNIIDHNTFDTYIQRMNVIADMEGVQAIYKQNNQAPNVKRIEDYLKFYNSFYGMDNNLVRTREFLTNDSNFHVSSSQGDFQNLRSVVEALAVRDDKSLHFIILNACRENTIIENEEQYKVSLSAVPGCVKKVIEVVKNASQLNGGKRSPKKNAANNTKKATKKKTTTKKSTQQRAKSSP